jgi:hypothetical protein
MDSALDDAEAGAAGAAGAGAGAESGAESTRRPVWSRKRKWTSELDALLLRKVKLRKPHGRRHWRKGNVYEIIAASKRERETTVEDGQ